jgi:hypothetical protein
MESLLKGRMKEYLSDDIVFYAPQSTSDGLTTATKVPSNSVVASIPVRTSTKFLCIPTKEVDGNSRKLD